MICPSARATPGTLRAWRARALGRGGRLARGLLGRLAGLASGVGGTGGGDVVRGLALDVGTHDGVGQLRDLAHDALEHLLLVGADRRGQRGGLIVADGPRQALDRRVGGDLQGLGGAGVLGVLQDLLLAAGAAQEIERRLAERERLPDNGPGEAGDRHQRVGAVAETIEPVTDASGVLARLAEVRLQAGAVRPPRRHRDLRLQHADERLLGGMRLVEVLHDLLLSVVHVNPI